MSDTPNQKPPFAVGTIAYFNEASTTANRKGRLVRFKGKGFGLMLGIVPPFGKDPSAQHVGQLLGTAGLILFDDIADFLGDEAAQKCIKMFEDKYYTPAAPSEGGAEVLEMDLEKEPSKLLNPAGLPIVRSEDATIVGLDGKPVS